jgi:uncharacterized protein YndB with AHSA1/START domain
MSNTKTNIVKDLKEKSILVSREFNAPLALVWRAYTESELLDRWWGPSPWRAETKTMNFKANGYWLYAMVSPEGEKHWAKMEYSNIKPMTEIGIVDAFCDEEGVINSAFPISTGSFIFTETKTGVLAEFKMTYPTEKDIQTLVEMGFEQGISIGLDQLEKLLASLSGI